MRSIVMILSTVIGVALLSVPVSAQVKTAKECRAEWQAKKADFQAKKIKEKDYVKQCTGGTAAKTTPAEDKTKKVRPKRTETKTKPEIKTEIKPKTKSAPRPVTTAPEPGPATRTSRAPEPTIAPPARSSRAAVGPNQFTTESQAKTRCGSDTVVWANLESKIYHFVGYKDYGGTKRGAYMCERDAANVGMRAAKNEKHP